MFYLACLFVRYLLHTCTHAHIYLTHAHIYFTRAHIYFTRAHIYFTHAHIYLTRALIYFTHALPPCDLLGLMESKGTKTLVREMASPLAGLSWLMARMGDKDRKWGLPGVPPTSWLLTKEVAREAGIEPRAGVGIGAEKEEIRGAAASPIPKWEPEVARTHKLYQRDGDTSSH